VQARGRALRLDGGWAEKVADNWAVVCLTADHPKGAADYARFVRKHDRYFARRPEICGTSASPTRTSRSRR